MIDSLEKEFQSVMGQEAGLIIQQVWTSFTRSSQPPFSEVEPKLYGFNPVGERNLLSCSVRSSLSSRMLLLLAVGYFQRSVCVVHMCSQHCVWCNEMGVQEPTGGLV
jgi:hypothetical protein